MTSNASPRELTLAVRGMQLSALAFGDPSRPLLLALHGWMDNAASFVPLAPHLTSHYVVALDLPGHGRSSHRPEGCAYFHADYALDVAHAAQTLGAERFALLGHSMGGGIATLVAAAHTDAVSQLIIIDGLGPYVEPADNTARQLGRAITQSLRPASPPRRYASLDALLARRAETSSDIDRAALKLIVERNAREQKDEQGQPYWHWTTDPRLKQASPTRLTPEAALNLVGSIEAPVLNLVASRGMSKQFPLMRERESALINGRTDVIDGHHHLHLDGAVDETAAAINAFLEAS
ncbi:MAG: alpha/beta hydrolase [Pseudomonadota bacterium]